MTDPLALVRYFSIAATSLIVSLFLAEAAVRILRPMPLAGWRVQPCISIPNERTGYRYAPNARARLSRFFEIETVVETNASDPAIRMKKASGRYA